MKSKILLVLFTALTFAGMSLKAQDRKTSEMQLKQQQEQYRDNYELQKKTVQAAYQRDMKALTSKNLTPAQRKTQMDLIKDRYEQQKKADQDAFKANMNTIKERREALNNGKHVGEDKDKDEMKMKHDKMKEKHEEKKEKHEEMKMKHEGIKMKHEGMKMKPMHDGKHK